MDNVKFNFLSWGQLESLSLEKFLLLNNNIPRGFSGNLIFAIIARMLCGNHLKLFHFIPHNETSFPTIWTEIPVVV